MSIKALNYSRFTVAAVIVILISIAGSGQSDTAGAKKSVEWVKFSPPDGSFQLELPGLPNATGKFNPGKADETEYFRCTRTLESAYKLDISRPYPRTYFQIGVFTISGCKRKPDDLKKEAKRLVSIYSADDPGDKILQEKDAVLGSQRGRIFETVNSSGTRIWDYFMEIDGRVYWMFYVSNDPLENVRENAERIFGSFRAGK